MKIIKNIKPIIIVLAILVFMLVAYVISTSFFEPKAYNFMVQNFSANKYGSDDIVIITIDDKSLERIRWPWKRELYSKIFEYLDKYSMAKAVGFDAIIATPDVGNLSSDLKFYSSIKGINNLSVGFVPLNSPYQAKADGKNYDKIFKNKFSIGVKDERTRKLPSFYQSLSKFPKQYFNSVSKVGSVITTPDFDGYIRSIDQFVDYKGTLYPSLSLRMYNYLHPDNTFIVKDDRIISTKSKLKIPAYSKYNGVFNNIHYYKLLPNSQYSHKTYSAIDIMDSLDNIKKGKPPVISPQVFEDKIVFVGANAKAIAVGLEDVKRTPISNDHPGVDLQATNLDNILHNEFLVQTGNFQDIFYLIILLGATFLVIRYFSLFASLGIVSVIMLAFIAVCILCYRFNIVINVITPIALQIITMTIAYSYRFILEGRNKEKIKSAMGRYISQDVMQNVVKDIDGLKLGGKRANVTVLFADIRGFTSMSEKMSAEEVSLILNEYFTEIEPIIGKYNGVINKFIGDAVMAIFGEPIQDKNHAENAVKCANEILERIEELQKKWLKEGKPKIEIGVGINSGEAFVGNIGSEKRLEYTVIGDVVNLASRIESYNKVYKTRFLISSTTYEKVRNLVDVIKISEVSIRGKAKKLNIYEVLRLVG
ncbi:MAG: adenylate/guanylate cyclase domain-containing protein [Candidatus Gastranaerophilaceae bacterium]